MTRDETLGNGRVLEGGFKRFAPEAEEIHVPTSSRRAALAGLAMYPACRPQAARAQRMAWRATALLGPRALRGRTAPWTPPMGGDVWKALMYRWQAEIGEFDGIAVASRKGEEATLRLLLMRDGEPAVLAKVAPTASAGLEREEAALRLLATSRPRSFRVPELLADGEAGGWRFLFTRPLPPKIHRVAGAPPLGRMVGEIHLGLSSLPRPSSPVPNHWHPMHGELAPWTVRALGGGALVILDWEKATWGPPGADEVFYRACVSALMDEPPGPIHVREAVEFWRRKMRSESPVAYRGPDFGERLVAALDRMATEARPGEQRV